MEVTTDIKRSDLIRFNLAILPRMRSTYVTILSIALLVFAFIAWDKGFPQSSNDWFAIIAGSVGGGIGEMVVGVVMTFIFILMSSSSSNGILEKHEYKVSSEGLYEVTSANEGLSKWEGIQDVKVVGSYILFRISGYLFHIIPERSFSTEESLQLFVREALEYWENAHKN
jgi:membrane protease YdiL (CAAX protease family)